jgi:hypothetical protein
MPAACSNCTGLLPGCRDRLGLRQDSEQLLASALTTMRHAVMDMGLQASVSSSCA